jgi:sulfite exporter TauE/SafE
MILTALIMGIAGSLHCAGMCSPLAMTVTSMKSPGFANRILYNLGRIIMYGILGLIVGTIGYMLPISEFQNLLSIVLGILLIVLALVGITGIRIPYISQGLTAFILFLKKAFSVFLSRKGSAAMLVLGSLNGLLPCGLTFLALSFCISLSTPLEGFLYMFVFGMGTLPVMLGIVSVASFIRNKTNWNTKTVATGLMMLSGMLLIARVFMVHLPDGHSHELDLVDIVICR